MVTLYDKDKPFTCRTVLDRGSWTDEFIRLDILSASITVNVSTTFFDVAILFLLGDTFLLPPPPPPPPQLSGMLLLQVCLPIGSRFSPFERICVHPVTRPVGTHRF